MYIGTFHEFQLFHRHVATVYVHDVITSMYRKLFIFTCILYWGSELFFSSANIQFEETYMEDTSCVHGPK